MFYLSQKKEAEDVNNTETLNTDGFSHIEPPAKLPDYFLRSNKSNINQ